MTTLVVIGHNPTMAYLAELIDDGEGDADATTGLVTRGFPTSALAVFTVDGAVGRPRARHRPARGLPRRRRA